MVQSQPDQWPPTHVEGQKSPESLQMLPILSVLFHRGNTFLEFKFTHVKKFPCQSFLSTLEVETLKDNPSQFSYFGDSESEVREVKWFAQKHTWLSGWAITKPGSLPSKLVFLSLIHAVCLCLSIQLANVIEETLISLAPKGFCG